MDLGSVRVLDRVLPSASTQTYSAKMVSSGYGKALYLAMTAGSSCDRPVTLSKTTPAPSCVVDVLLVAGVLVRRSSSSAVPVGVGTTKLDATATVEAVKSQERSDAVDKIIVLT